MVVDPPFRRGRYSDPYFSSPPRRPARPARLALPSVVMASPRGIVNGQVFWTAAKQDGVDM